MPLELPPIYDATPPSPGDQPTGFGISAPPPSHNDPAYLMALSDEQFLALVPVLRSKFGRPGLAEAELARRGL